MKENSPGLPVAACIDHHRQRMQAKNRDEADTEFADFGEVAVLGRSEQTGQLRFDDVAIHALARVLDRRGERERGLARTRGRHGQEVGPLLERERVERLGLPRAEPDAGRSDRGGTRGTQFFKRGPREYRMHRDANRRSKP